MTIHELDAMITAVHNNILLFKAELDADGVVLSPRAQALHTNLLSESERMIAGTRLFSLQTGAGIFPNTFQTTKVPFKYRIVVNEEEEEAAEDMGMVVAYFPQTMRKAGAPDVVVHTQDQKETATRAGYSLPMI